MSEYESEQNPQDAAAPEPEAPVEDAQPEPQFDAQAAYGHIAGQLDELKSYLASQSQQEPEPEPQFNPEDFDPFDPNALQGVVDRSIQSQIAPLVQALQPLVEQHNDAQSSQYVENVFGRLGVPDDLKDEVLIMSGGYRLAGQSPEQAINSAYASIQGLRGQGVSQGREDQRQELEQIVNAPGVANGGQPGAVAAESRPGNMEESAMRIAARLGIT